MFIVSLTYKCELDQVETHLPAHIEYLKKQYSLGNFIASGRKVPRNGGVILARANSKSELNTILEQDPFHKNDIADYDVQEFIPTMVGEGLETLREDA